MLLLLLLFSLVAVPCAAPSPHTFTASNLPLLTLRSLTSPPTISISFNSHPLSPFLFLCCFRKKKIEPNSDGDHLIRKNERMLAPGKNAQRGGCRRLVSCIAVLGRKEGFGSLSERGRESTMRTPYPAH